MVVLGTRISDLVLQHRPGLDDDLGSVRAQDDARSRMSVLSVRRIRANPSTLWRNSRRKPKVRECVSVENFPAEQLPSLQFGQPGGVGGF
jgi:hypothetical protein